tara:strand:+ start:1005 stop:1727 length:723 start_codon:yes stop_codon:yes gene_type:complete
MKLSVKNISKNYSAKIAIDNISFTMNSGNTLGLLGPNGAGKTTLFYMIAGLLKKDSGSIRLDSEEVSEKTISERSSLGLSYLPQEASIFRKLTVKENILTSLQQRKDLDSNSTIDELNQLLDEFNLHEFSDTLGIKLSGGERRRTEIARSLASNPRFILLDEPFAGIDPIAVSDLKSTIKHLKSKNIGVLISDHNVRDTMQICDQVLIINQGKLMAKGKPQEVSNDPLVKEVYLGKDFIQ